MLTRDAPAPAGTKDSSETWEEQQKKLASPGSKGAALAFFCLGIRVSLPISLTPHAIRSRETEKIGEKLALELVNEGGGEDE
jgi:hypothetical protein